MNLNIKCSLNLNAASLEKWKLYYVTKIILVKCVWGLDWRRTGRRPYYGARGIVSTSGSLMAVVAGLKEEQLERIKRALTGDFPIIIFHCSSLILYCLYNILHKAFQLFCITANCSFMLRLQIGTFGAALLIRSHWKFSSSYSHLSLLYQGIAFCG